MATFTVNYTLRLDGSVEVEATNPTKAVEFVREKMSMSRLIAAADVVDDGGEDVTICSVSRVYANGKSKDVTGELAGVTA